jgi:hypothetical protein
MNCNYLDYRLQYDMFFFIIKKKKMISALNSLSKSYVHI